VQPSSSPTRYTIISVNAPKNRFVLVNAKPMPVTAAGGKSALATPTPTSISGR